MKCSFLFTGILLLAAFRVGAQSVGGVASGSAVYCDSVNAGFISLNSFSGAVLYWESSIDGGSTWKHLQNPTSTQSYNNLKVTTGYRAIVQDSSFPPDTSTIATITIHVPGQSGTVTGGGTFCGNSGNGTLTLENTGGTVLFWQSSDEPGNWKSLAHPQFTLAYSSITKNTRYRVIVETFSGCDADTSAEAVLLIDEFSNAGQITGSDSVCVNSAGDTLFAVGYQGLLQNWLLSKDGGIIWHPTDNVTAIYIYPSVTETTLYRVTSKNGICPADTSEAAVVAVYTGPVAHAGDDVTITRYESVVLNGSGAGRASWYNASTLNNDTIFKPVAEPINNTTYVLSVTDRYGCISSDSVLVTVLVPIPSAITPNGDGVNDIFEIHEIEKYTRNNLKIFDRWGMLLYEASPYKNEWRGTNTAGEILSDGFYYYAFDYGNGEKPVGGFILIKRH